MNQQPPWQSNQPPYGQQPPWYNQPTQLSPGQFQQPPYNPPPPGFLEWLKTRTRGVKIGLGCGTLVVIILFFTLVNTIFGVGNSTTSATPATPTATFAPTAVQSSPVATVGSSPTLEPTHHPVPTPTTRLTLAPTQAFQPTQPPRPTQPPPPTPTPRPMPTPQPTQPPPPTPTPRPTCQAINNNPWCYNFSLGNLITNPPANFCSYFNCIASFVEPDDPDGGYVVECSDGTYSWSGGERGACSFHGGVLKPLYSH